MRTVMHHVSSCTYGWIISTEKNIWGSFAATGRKVSDSRPLLSVVRSVSPELLLLLYGCFPFTLCQPVPSPISPPPSPGPTHVWLYGLQRLRGNLIPPSWVGDMGVLVHLVVTRNYFSWKLADYQFLEIRVVTDQKTLVNLS